jgi:hypothetical protein
MATAESIGVVTLDHVKRLLANATGAERHPRLDGAEQEKRTPGKGGRPPKDQTGAIQAKWAEMGNPKPTAVICDKLANDFFGDELKGINRGTPEHRKVRERVRQAIQRGTRASATYRQGFYRQRSGVKSRGIRDIRAGSLPIESG